MRPHLSIRALERWGDDCPCCGIRMRRVRMKPGKATPVDYPTKGHDKPVARGGDWRVWLWMCSRCNEQQGYLSLAQWVNKLFHYGDPRGPRVREVAKFVAAWVEEKDRAA